MISGKYTIKETISLINGKDNFHWLFIVYYSEIIYLNKSLYFLPYSEPEVDILMLLFLRDFAQRRQNFSCLRWEPAFIKQIMPGDLKDERREGCISEGRERKKHITPAGTGLSEDQSLIHCIEVVSWGDKTWVAKIETEGFPVLAKIWSPTFQVERQKQWTKADHED